MTEKSENTKENASVTPLAIKFARCKSCAKCVRVCPAGVLSMRRDTGSIYGVMVSIDRLDLCIGCAKCENACPDFAILTADKKDYTFPKLSAEARERQAKILENDCLELSSEGEKQ